MRFYPDQADEARGRSDKEIILFLRGRRCVGAAADRNLETGQDWWMREGAPVGITVGSLHCDATAQAAKPQASPVVCQRREDLAEAETPAALLGQ